MEARDLGGTVAITGADGTVHLTIADVNATNGDALTGRLTARRLPRWLRQPRHAGRA